MTNKSSPKSIQAQEDFIQLFRENSDRLFNYLYYLLRDPMDAEDALQETGRICWQKFDQYDRSMKFRAWACGIAYIEAKKIGLKRKERGIFCSDKFFESISKEAIAMSERLDERSVALELCLESLPEKDRILINQRYVFDSSVQELAESLGRSVHAIYRSLRRVHDMLQRCINRSLAEQ